MYRLTGASVYQFIYETIMLKTMMKKKRKYETIMLKTMMKKDNKNSNYRRNLF